MIDRQSRYAGCEVLQLLDQEGREVSFLDRRIIGDTSRIAGHAVVEDGDRLDLVANRAYGDATRSWLVMDANPDPEPLALADRPGRRLRLSRPGEGR